jgi:Leucine Rich repeat
MYLNELNLSRNNLNDDFAKELAKCLNFNDVLCKVDISNNPIGEVGALALLTSLKEANESLISLGDLQT